MTVHGCFSPFYNSTPHTIPGDSDLNLLLFIHPPPPQELANANAAELGMQTVPSLNIAYTQEKGYVTADVAKAENLTMLSLSGTKFRKMLR